jgi:hypothetical protein
MEASSAVSITLTTGDPLGSSEGFATAGRITHHDTLVVAPGECLYQRHSHVFAHAGGGDRHAFRRKTYTPTYTPTYTHGQAVNRKRGSGSGLKGHVEHQIDNRALAESCFRFFIPKEKFPPCTELVIAPATSCRLPSTHNSWEGAEFRKRLHIPDLIRMHALFFH